MPFEELNRCAVEKKTAAKNRFLIEPHSIWYYSASVAKFWQLTRELGGESKRIIGKMSTKSSPLHSIFSPTNLEW